MRYALLAAALSWLIQGCGPMDPAMSKGHELTDLVRAKIETDNLTAELTCPMSDHTPDKVSIDVDNAKTYVDSNREIKDLGTEFVVKEFFDTKETLFNFLKLVYSKLDEAIKNYRTEKLLADDAVVFIFKGGNVMRMLANETFKALPPDPAKLLRDKYAEFFKRSDADFSVFVDPEKLHVLNYESVMDDLTELTYKTLGSIRDEISANPELYFNFSQLSQRIAGRKLDKYYGNLQHINALDDKENDKWYKAKFTQLQLQGTRAQKAPACVYEGQYDYLFQFDGKDKSKIVGIPLSTRGKWIMNTINKSLEWPSGLNPKDLVKFYLVRSKVQFEYTFVKDGVSRRVPIGGELIDVSFPHRDDFRLASFFKNLSTGVADYKLSLEGTDETLDLKAESLTGIATDLHEVLFEQFPRPWEASKYEKRINRLFFFSIVEMLGHVGLGSAKTSSYVAEALALLNQMEKVLPKSANSKAQADSVLTGLNSLKSKHPHMQIANHFFEALGELVSSRILNEPKDDDQEKFQALAKLVKENLETMNALAKFPARKTNMSRIYDVSMKSLF